MQQMISWRFRVHVSIDHQRRAETQESITPGYPFHKMLGVRPSENGMLQLRRIVDVCTFVGTVLRYGGLFAEWTMYCSILCPLKNTFSKNTLSGFLKE